MKDGSGIAADGVGHDLSLANPSLPSAKKIWSAALAFLSANLSRSRIDEKGISGHS